jgi:heterodisulfide reductase subunit C
LRVENTDGPASPCYQCGVCTATCPWNLVRAEPLKVRQLVRQTQLAAPTLGEEIWLCTSCQACQTLCPRGVDITGVMQLLRQRAWQAGQVPAGFNNLMWDLYWDGNPYGRPPSERSTWARGLDRRVVRNARRRRALLRRRRAQPRTARLHGADCRP